MYTVYHKHASSPCNNGWFRSRCTKICLRMCHYNTCFVGQLFVLCFLVPNENIVQLLMWHKNATLKNYTFVCLVES